MRGLLALVVAITVPQGCSEDDSPSLGAQPASGAEWINRIGKTIQAAKSAQWTVSLDVRKGVEGSLSPGIHRFQFDIDGPNRAHWVEEHSVGSNVVKSEAWYQGYKLYRRSSETPNDLQEIRLGEKEGDCIALSAASGGIVGWQLVHMTIMGGLATDKAKVVGEEQLDGQSSVVVEYEIKIGGVCGKYQDYPGCRMWIDRERGVPLKREYRFTLKLQGKEASFEAVETYSNWSLGIPISEAVFHTEGMGPSDPLSDLPSDEEAFEKVQTENALGVAVRDFPNPQGPKCFDDLGPNVQPSFFEVSSRSPSGPAPKASYERRERVVDTSPDGTLVEAYLGHDDQEEIAPGHSFKSDRTNRRHQYGGGAYHSMNVYIGPRVEGKIRPELFFRDVGSHNTAPHHFAMDSRGRCHLSVADVDIGQSNRFKLYYVLGDLQSGRWEQAWLVDYAPGFTSSAKSWNLTAGDKVQLVWHRDLGVGLDESGIFHVEWSTEGFGRKTRVVKGDVDVMDVAVDRQSGWLLLIYRTKQGIFLVSRSLDGKWSAPERLDMTVSGLPDLSVQSTGQGVFIARVNCDGLREWEVRLK